VRFTSCLVLSLLAASAHSTALADVNEDARKADAKLNEVYQRVIARLSADRQEALRNAQRNWIAFRDGTCTFESGLKTGASRDWVDRQTRPALDPFCIQRLTLERVAHLQRYSDILSADAPQVTMPSAPTESSCRLDKLPKDFTVRAIGVYRGEIDTDIQLESGNETKVIEVIVNEPDENVVVVLMAYDPVVWQLKRTRKSRIAAVIVGGYHAQAVLGIERSVPLLFATHQGRKDCGQYFHAYEAGKDLLQANTAIQNLTGRQIDQLWSSHKGSRVHIGTQPAGDMPLVSSTDYKPEDYTSLPRFPSGQKGIDRLVELGLLRRATPQDLDAWVEKASAQYKRFNPSLAVRRPMAPQGEYVVLGKITYPTGLYGGHSVAFFIPPGVPLPDGTPGHSAVYYMEDGTCRGAVCQGDH
jgi:uncharacterized protein YecT (DUF1311 family)